MNAESIYNLIQRKGVDATIRTYPDASFDPDTNRTTLGTAVDYSVKVVPPYNNREGLKAAEMISSGKGLTGIANYNLEFIIQAGLKIIIGSKEWTVIGYTEIKDNTGILFYTLEIESGS